MALVLTEDEVVRPEKLTKGSGSHRIHRTRLQVDQDGPRHVLSTCKLEGMSKNTAWQNPPNMKLKLKAIRGLYSPLASL